MITGIQVMEIKMHCGEGAVGTIKEVQGGYGCPIHVQWPNGNCFYYETTTSLVYSVIVYGKGSLRM